MGTFNEDNQLGEVRFCAGSAMWLNYGVRILQSGIKCVKLDGSMTMQSRDQMIDRFTNDPDCKVISNTE